MVHTELSTDPDSDDDTQLSNEMEICDFMRTGDNRILKRILVRQLLHIDIHNNKYFKRAKTHALLYALIQDSHTNIAIQVERERERESE